MYGIPNLSERAKQAGYRLTPSRRTVISVLERADCHLTPADVLERGRVLRPNLSRPTVYRTLQALVELRLIRPIYLGDTEQRFITTEGCHHHLICTQCGSVTEVDECLLGNVEDRLSEEYHFQAVSHLVEFSGLCENCQRR